MVFQDRPCRIVEAVRPAPDVGRAIATGMHESWFERPESARGKATCTARQCACGSLVQRLNPDVVQAVAEALYIDGSWHGTARCRRAPEKDRTRRTARTSPVSSNGSHCEIMIAQLVLRRHARTAVRTLRRDVSDASARRPDDPASCDAGDLRACTRIRNEERRAMLLADVAALRLPRE